MDRLHPNNPNSPPIIGMDRRTPGERKVQQANADAQIANLAGTIGECFEKAGDADQSKKYFRIAAEHFKKILAEIAGKEL